LPSSSAGPFKKAWWGNKPQTPAARLERGKVLSDDRFGAFQRAREKENLQPGCGPPPAAGMEPSLQQPRQIFRASVPRRPKGRLIDGHDHAGFRNSGAFDPAAIALGGSLRGSSRWRLAGSMVERPLPGCWRRRWNRASRSIERIDASRSSSCARNSIST
jgi:hypothetical protein